MNDDHDDDSETGAEMLEAEMTECLHILYNVYRNLIHLPAKKNLQKNYVWKPKTIICIWSHPFSNLQLGLRSGKLMTRISQSELKFYHLNTVCNVGKIRIIIFKWLSSLTSNQVCVMISLTPVIRESFALMPANFAGLYHWTMAAHSTTVSKLMFWINKPWHHSLLFILKPDYFSCNDPTKCTIFQGWCCCLQS